MIDRHKAARAIKKILYSSGEPYTFRGLKLLFVVGSRPIKRKYINSSNVIVRNDVLQIEYFEKNFESNNVLWDIGSHHGHYSIICAAVAGGESQVFSFEPDAQARKVQEDNIRLNKFAAKIKLLSYAVSDVEGEIRFESQNGNANSHIVKHTDNSAISVSSTTLNNLLKVIPKPTFVKIDTEGAEIDIIKSASELLRDPSITFICELHPFAWEAMKVRYADLTGILQKYNRTISPLDPRCSVSDLPFYGTVLF